MAAEVTPPHCSQSLIVPKDEFTIDLEKFDKILSKYVKGTFAFSENEINETIEEVYDLAVKCCTRRSRPAPQQPDPCNECDQPESCDEICKHRKEIQPPASPALAELLAAAENVIEMAKNSQNVEDWQNAAIRLEAALRSEQAQQEHKE